ncbi:MAG TPA: UDP-N-acetylmuramate dehydrogenase [bacterium]|nr:UDP-N-acetylmuramate dehydrogenase [bacterium]HPN44288.1 UDP-N-acetylmuramate dehydrogenase [bacterium]
MNIKNTQLERIIPKNHVLYNEPLNRHSNIKIGGPADSLVTIADKDTFVQVVKYCRVQHIRFLTLGSATNVLFADAGFRGLVLIANFTGIQLVHENTIDVQAGTSLADIKRFCIAHSLTGFEFASGIPGTIGGAIYGNAGAYGKSISDCLRRATVLTPNGQVREVNKEFFNFAYRDSELKRNNCILISAELEFTRGDYAQILSKVREIHAIRANKLPHWSVPTAGSYFKNIKDAQGNATAAAVYLEAVGSKQTSVGDAAVHPKHANIIYNRGNARAADVLELEAILKKRVFEQFGIELQREVMYIE